MADTGSPGTRDFLCDEGHYTPIDGFYHWNVWGSPDFEAWAPLKCGAEGCVAAGHLLSKEEQAQRDTRGRGTFIGDVYFYEH